MPGNRTGIPWILLVVMLVLAGLAGVLIPLATGSRPAEGAKLGGPRSTWASPTPTRTLIPTASPSVPPAPTRTPTRTATARPPAASAVPAATATARLTVTLAAPVAATATASAITARVMTDTVLLLRTGPGPDYPIVAMAQTDATFTVTGRSRDAAWLRVCCVDAAPVWLAAQFVTLAGVLEHAPVVEPTRP